MTSAPALLPGTPVVWRDATTLQIGFRIAIPDAPRAALAAVRLLDGRRALEQIAQQANVPLGWLEATVRALISAGVVAAPGPRSGVVLLAPDGWRERLARLLPDGLRVVEDARQAEVALVVGPLLGTRPWLPDDVGTMPHLVVAPLPGGMGVGPFVLPGRTPCQMCCALTLGGRDPAWPRVAAQAGSAAVPADPASEAWAAGLAASHLQVFAADGRPETLGRSFELVNGRLSVRDWPRHPDCHCALAAA